MRGGGPGCGEDCTLRTSSRMITIVQNIRPLVYLLIATTLEVSGDALVRLRQRLRVVRPGELGKFVLRGSRTQLLQAWDYRTCCP